MVTKTRTGVKGRCGFRVSGRTLLSSKLTLDPIQFHVSLREGLSFFLGLCRPAFRERGCFSRICEETHGGIC